MYIQIITETHGLFDRESIEHTALKISRRTDFVDIKNQQTLTSRCSKKRQDKDTIVISVFQEKTKVEKPHFLIRVREEAIEDHFIEPRDILHSSICHAEAEKSLSNMINCSFKESTGVLDTLLTTLLGYEMIYLKGIIVKDRNKNRIKPVIKILIPCLPFFRIEKELALEKKMTVTRESNRNKHFEDMCQICITDDEILLSLLEEYDLMFSSASNFYKIILRDEQQVLIIRQENVQQLFLVESVYQGEVMRKINNFLGTKARSVNRMITDAIMYPFDEEVDLACHKEITRVSKERGRRDLDFLYNLVCMCPRFKDHRAVYIKRIEDIFLKKTGRGGNRKDVYDLNVRTEYLAIRREKNIDNIPVGTLKELYTRGNVQHRIG